MSSAANTAPMTMVMASIYDSPFSAFRFSRCMMGHHSRTASTMGTPRQMTDMARQLMNSFFARSYSSLYK